MVKRIVHLPQIIHYGKDSFLGVGEEAKKLGSKALIVSDRIMEQLGNVQQLHDHLHSADVSYVEYLGVETEPKDTYVDEALQLLRAEQCDHVIALGGGSCIDTAKAVAVLATNTGRIHDYMNQKQLATVKPLPLIAVPTTGGTGSEATDVTVITDTKEDIKMMIKQQAFMPLVAIVDPVLTVSTPKSVTAATGVDALTHAIESLISRKAQPFTRTLSLQAIELLYANIREAYHNGDNLEARDQMIYGSMLAGMAFSNASTCLVHGMSRPLGAVFHVPHGVSNAMLLPIILEYTKVDCQEDLATIARMINKDVKDESDEELSNWLVEEIEHLCEELEIPTLSGWGIDREAFDLVKEKMAEDALISGSPATNPKVPTKEEIVELYDQLMNYSYTKRSETHAN
ncbi:alcohol dehydrogenase [Bacillaceae bacterium JMAK1]|nr:alcohol dehydrogenase [Bacillaceae bacterium JMAK1]